EDRMQMESLDAFRGALEDYRPCTITDLKTAIHAGCPWRCERETASDYFHDVHMLSVSDDVREVACHVSNHPQMDWTLEMDRYHLAAATVYRMDYFLTLMWEEWPAQLLRDLHLWSQERGWMVPEFVTPHTLCTPH